jgi:hypothetical protein
MVVSRLAMASNGTLLSFLFQAAINGSAAMPIP